MSYLRSSPESLKAAQALCATAWRLLVVFSLALTAALAARATLGPTAY